MSGDLPAGYDAWRTRTPHDDERDCPETCASQRVCPMDCGGCYCQITSPCCHCESHEPGECDCPSLAELQAEAAEGKRDAIEDR